MRVISFNYNSKGMTMAYWKWDPAFSVGIAVIDNQHKRIIEYINELASVSLYTNQDKTKVHTVLLSLIEYTESHFSFEESLMKEAGYSMLEAHKQVHISFIDRINFFKERYENGEDITKQLMMDLQIWLINHIQHDDTDYKIIVQAMLKKREIAPNEGHIKDGWLKVLVDKFFK